VQSGGSIRLTHPTELPAKFLPLRFVIVILLLWLVPLPFTQPEQRRGWEADTLMASGRIDEALHFMSAHAPGDFPPHFDARPRNWTGQNLPDILDVMARVAAIPPADWVREIYLSKFENEIMGIWSRRIAFSQLVPILEAIPEGPEIASKFVSTYGLRDEQAANAGEREYAQRLGALADGAAPRK